MTGELLVHHSVSVSHAEGLAHWSDWAALNVCVYMCVCGCTLTCLCSGVWGQRMLFQGHCWCGTKWTSPGGRPVTSGRPLPVSTTAVTSLLGHIEQSVWCSLTLMDCYYWPLWCLCAAASLLWVSQKHTRIVTSQTEYKSFWHFCEIKFFFLCVFQVL